MYLYSFFTNAPTIIMLIYYWLILRKKRVNNVFFLTVIMYNIGQKNKRGFGYVLEGKAGRNRR